jgi:hypothetical protein
MGGTRARCRGDRCCPRVDQLLLATDRITFVIAAGFVALGPFVLLERRRKVPGASPFPLLAAALICLLWGCIAHAQALVALASLDAHARVDVGADGLRRALADISQRELAISLAAFGATLAPEVPR